MTVCPRCLSGEFGTERFQGTIHELTGWIGRCKDPRCKNEWYMGKVEE